MKNYLRLLLLFVILSSGSFAQNRELTFDGNITGIDIRNKAKVHLATGPQKVSTSAAPSSSENVTLQNGTLRISGDVSDLYVTVPDLQRIDIAGVGTILADSVIKVKNLRIDISGIGKIVMPLQAERLQIGISGMGKLQLSGTGENVEMNISGNGKIDGLNYRTSNCVANVSGITKTYMDVTGVLDLNISGTGSFYYRSTPAQVNSSISGIGKHMTYNSVTKTDTSVIEIGNSKILIVDEIKEDDNSVWTIIRDSIAKKPEYSKSHWMGVDLGFNYLAHGNGLSSDMPDGLDYLELNSGKSVNVNLNFFAYDFKLYKRFVMFTTGIGLSLNNYRFDSDLTLSNNRPLSAAADVVNGDTLSYEKNKLAVNYVTVPLLLQFNTNEINKKSFHLAAGVLLNYKYNSHLKLVYNDEKGEREKTKRRGEYNIQPFRADLTLRAGYKNWTVYASYGLNSLFRDGRGPEIHPVQFGINFLGW
jgi:hypothetical protein